MVACAVHGHGSRVPYRVFVLTSPTTPTAYIHPLRLLFNQLGGVGQRGGGWAVLFICLVASTLPCTAMASAF
jgi:hypothetical protein